MQKQPIKHLMMIFLFNFTLWGCAVKPPSLFEVQQMCEEGKVQQYKVRTKEVGIDFRCK